MCREVVQRAETGRKDGMSCVPPKVVLGAGRKDGMRCSQELDSRYDYLGVSYSLMCDAQENLEGDWTQNMIILV